jgi:hypothetical protein
MSGHNNRARGSPQKTFKKPKLDLTEEEMLFHWTNFKNKLEEIFEDKQHRYENEDPLFLVDIHLKPHLKNIE